MKNQVFEKVVDYELSIPRMDVEVSKEMIWQKVKGRYQSIYDWFVGKEGQENEAGKLLMQQMILFAGSQDMQRS